MSRKHVSAAATVVQIGNAFSDSFFVGERCNCTEIYRQFLEQYGENAMPRHAIAKWYNVFKDGRTDIDDTEGEGRPSTVTNSEVRSSRE